MAVTNLGNIAIVPDGQWSSTKTYTRNRLVYHTNGNSYVARKDVPAGTAITNVEYWQLSGSRGVDGDVTTAAMDAAIEYAVAQSENALQNQIDGINSGIVGHTSRIVNLEEDLAPIKSVLGAPTTAAQARTNLGVTPANIGAAPTTHTHAASDITTVIPVTGGGSGASTAAGAIANFEYATHMVIYSATEPTVVSGKIWLKPI